MKKRGCLLVMVLVVTMLTGCASELTTIPDMTRQQRQEISEYAVELLLKYDKDSQSRLVDLSVFEDEVEDIPEDVLSKDEPGMDPVEDTPTIEIEDNPVIEQISLEELLHLPETISIKYLDYLLTDIYPANVDEFYQVEAGIGKKLLILKFELSNTGVDPKTVNMIGKDFQYRVKINDDKEKLTVLTFTLEDELSTYMDTLISGQSVELVLVAEFDEADVADVNSLHLSVVTKDKRDTVKLY